jgi:hypothetical protein
VSLRVVYRLRDFNKISNTQRAGVEQRLLVRSFERALATLDTQEFKGKTVAVDFYGLTPTRIS